MQFVSDDVHTQHAEQLQDTYTWQPSWIWIFKLIIIPAWHVSAGIHPVLRVSVSAWSGLMKLSLPLSRNRICIFVWLRKLIRQTGEQILAFGSVKKMEHLISMLECLQHLKGITNVLQNKCCWRLRQMRSVEGYYRFKSVYYVWGWISWRLAPHCTELNSRRAKLNCESVVNVLQTDVRVFLIGMLLNVGCQTVLRDQIF